MSPGDGRSIDWSEGLSPAFSRSGKEKIGVYLTRDPEPDRPHMPIGMAMGGDWDNQGRATWRLTVGKVGLPGLWVVVDRVFRPASVA